MIQAKAALIVIDMENGFVLPGAAHCIAMSKDTLRACGETIAASRKAGIPVFFVKRIYRDNGSDVELTRWENWKEGGRLMGPGSNRENGACVPPEVKPQPGDYTIIKPRWSAFFQTELDLILRRLGINTVVLIGTTTPNCIRTTAYDANALDYEVIVIEDACSSQTPEIQKANIDDMQRMGAFILSSSEYFSSLPDLKIKGWVDAIRKDIKNESVDPEPFEDLGQGCIGWSDKW